MARRRSKTQTLMCLRFLRHGETEALGIKQNQLEALRGGFKLGEGSKGAQTKNPATLKELPDFERSGLCSDVVTRTGIEPMLPP